MNEAYELAKGKYQVLHIDTEKAMDTLARTPISIHCWQGDDVGGFENTGEALSGGIQATGNYIGKARTPDELMADFEKAISLIGGQKRINLHACYAIFDTGEKADRDQLLPKHFEKWVAFAKRIVSALILIRLSSAIRWSRVDCHCRLPTRKCAPSGCGTGSPAAGSPPISPGNCTRTAFATSGFPDGFKDVPADRFTPRKTLQKSLDEIFREKLTGVIDCVESKVFGIGMEAYTVGSSEFYLGYAASHENVYDLMDSGHYHPTEVISDKISAMLCYFDKVPLHVTRPVRWDSDHVVRLDDELQGDRAGAGAKRSA